MLNIEIKKYEMCEKIIIFIYFSDSAAPFFQKSRAGRKPETEKKNKIGLSNNLFKALVFFNAAWAGGVKGEGR